MKLNDLKTKASLAAADLLDRVLRTVQAPDSAPPARPLELEELENRVLMSASPAAVVMDPAAIDPSAGPMATVDTASVSTGTLDQTSAADTDDVSLDNVMAEVDRQATENDAQTGDTADSSDFDSQAMRQELVFVDTSVEDYQQLLDDLWSNDDSSREFEVVLLQNSRDGIEQISEALNERSDLDAVHFVTHGTDGRVKLGGTWLDTDSLRGYAGEIAGWSHSLTADADLLFYGCDLAGSADGQDLVESLSTLTGADVAASADDTGAAILGGDWELEYVIGDLESEVAFSPFVRTEWYGTLDASQGSEVDDDETDSSQDVEYLSAPLAFEENAGQTDAAVDFLARGSGYTVFLSDGDAVLQVTDGGTDYAVRLELEGANSAAAVEGENQLASRSNYLVGEESQWLTGLSNYGRVRYSNVYDGIDVAYYGKERLLEYDFIVDAGADASLIRLNFTGADSLRIDHTGELVIALSTGGDEIRFRAPYSYQESDSGRQTVASQYRINADGTVSFELGEYDASRELVIDPILDYSTFVGGTGNDQANAIGVDAAGDVYIAGLTGSAVFPTTTGALDESFNGSFDAFVTKLSSDGTSVVYSTYFGGSGQDEAEDLFVNSSGEVYITGETRSADLPTTAGVVDTSLVGTNDGFVAKLNAAGDTLLYSTYLGGSNLDVGKGITVDSSGNAYIAGYTGSSDFPVTGGAHDTSLSGTRDAFVAKLNSTATSITYATYYGGSSSDEGLDIAIDSSNRAHVVGRSFSSNLSTNNAFDGSANGNEDGYFIVLSADGSTLDYGTYLGGSADDEVLAVDTDGSDNTYLTGTTASSAFPTTGGAYDTSHNGDQDVFVMKFDASQNLSYSTFLGETGHQRPRDIAVDSNGNAWVVGEASNSTIPVTGDAYQSGNDGIDNAFIAQFDATGATLEYATHIGGTNRDEATGVAIDSSDNVYVTGHADSSDFDTTSGAYDETHNGSTDAFVAKFSTAVPSPADWDYRRQLTFNNLSQTENLADFPVLVALDATRIDYSQTQNNGEDLRFYDSDNTTLLAHEIEEWNESGTSYVWVRIPQIDGSSSSDFIWMYYGNDSAADGQDAPNVWSAGYQGVWHLDETGAVTREDATSNSNDGTPTGVTNDPSGQVSAADSFNGSDYINVGTPGSLDITGDITVSAWVKVDGGSGTQRPIVGKGDTQYMLRAGDENDFEFFTHNGSFHEVNANGSFTQDQWYYVTGRVDGTEVSLWVDGVKQTQTRTGGITSNSEDVEIGRNSQVTSRDFHGTIDEVRISNVARSADWIAAQYSSITDTFVTFGAEEHITANLDYSTYLGGSGSESISEIAVHSSGDVFIVGRTTSADLSTTAGAFDTSFSGGSDLYVARLSPDGSGSADLVYLTYLGGIDDEFGASIQVDAAGNAYVAGATQSSDFPATGGAYDTTLGGTQDSFVVKLDPTGSSLVYGTYFGGDAGSESGPDLFVDSTGRAHIAGQVRSNDMPTVNAYDSTLDGEADIYVARISADGSTLEYSTYLGGSTGNVGGGNIAVDSGGLIYVANYTLSADYPTTAGAYQTTLNGTQDATLSVFDPSLSGAATLVYSTFFGGSGDEGFSDVVVDSGGNVFLMGSTDSSDLPTTAGAYDTTFAGADDLAIIKIDPSGNGSSDLLYSTYIGGTGDEDAGNIELDSNGDLYFVGTAESGFTTVNAIQPSHGGGSDDAIVGLISTDGAGTDDLLFASYLGGTGEDKGRDLAVDSSNTVHVVGFTSSTDYATTSGAYDTSANGSNDNFVSTLSGVSVASMAATTTTFQEGTNGYTGTQDTELDSGSATTDKGSNTSISIDLDDGSGEAQGLIRFDGIIGSDPGDIPQHVQITSASLTVNSTDNSSNTISLHRMLQSWSESSTWDSLTGGLTANDTELALTPDSQVVAPTPGTITFTGLETTVQAWVDGETNYGWGLLSDGTDGWDFDSSEGTTPPVLSVSYIAPGSQSSVTHTLTVDTTSDVWDGDTTSIDALLLDPGADGFISLREAIRAANNTENLNASTPDVINFAIGSGLQTITLASQLPALTDAVTLDATTQPGYAGTPLIQLDGGSTSSFATAGILVWTSDSTVKGFIVHSFDDEGIEIDGTGHFGPADNNIIEDNWIGIDSTGAAAANGDSGILITDGASDNTIQNNVISGNTSAGIVVRDAATDDNAILGNTIYSNGGLGIDLNDDSIATLNDSNDADTGPNDLQNFPVLTSVVTTGTQVTITGTLETDLTNQDYRVEFFSNDSADGSGYGEGRRYLGFSTVTTNGSGDGTINAVLSVPVAFGASVTATATVDLGGGDYGSTSEFGLNVLATGTSVITVDTTSDVADGDTSSIEALLADTGSDGSISLREAIIAANNSTNGSSRDEIHFDITDALVGGAHTIDVSSGGLPQLSDAVIIDGTTDSDFSGTPIIELNGTSAGAAVDGLSLANGSDGSTIRGLVINRFDGDGIHVLAGADGNTIAGNYLGTDVAGTTALGNNQRGLRVESANNIIGGTTAADRNVASGNQLDGILITSASATNNTIVGNYVGLDATGTADLGNTEYGVRLNVGAAGTIVGGDTAGERNLISGNQLAGVDLSGSATTGITIQGNYIGTDVTGTQDVGNTGQGVLLRNGANDNLIGGTGAGEGNLIAHNSTGVSLFDGVGSTDENSILGNSISSHTNLGIDHESDGLVEPNDSGDADAGPNSLQNFPVITQAELSGTDLVVSGTLDTDGASTQYRIEFFGIPSGSEDATNGEGTQYLGATTITTSFSGDGVFSNVLLSGVSLSVGDLVTATVTEVDTPAQLGVDDLAAYGDTSEFAANFSVTLASNTVIVDSTTDVSDGTTTSIAALIANPGADGFISLREAITATNNTANLNASTPDEIHFNISGTGPHTISIGSALPDLTESVIIDGTTQEAFGGDDNPVVAEVTTGPEVIIDASATTDVPGLRLTANDISVLSIGVTGTNGTAIAASGIYVTGTNATIDDVTVTDSGVVGIFTQGSSGTSITNSVLRNNGVDNNLGDGIVVQGPVTSFTIAGNEIIGNAAYGIDLPSTSPTGVMIENNVIRNNGGGGSTQTAGIGVRSGSDVLIRNNEITGSTGDGISVVDTSTDITIIGNTFSSNGDLAIDLSATTNIEGDGVTTNDSSGNPEDQDTGANNLQNYPEIQSAILDGTDLTLDGRLRTDALNTQFRIEFYGVASATADATGHGEGEAFLGAATVTTDGDGRVDFTGVTLSGVSLNAGDFVTATATEIVAPAQIGVDDVAAYGDTSEFADNFVINLVPTITSIANQTVDEDNSTGPLAFTVGDAETAAGSLVVTAVSNNQTLIPNANITLGGSGANRTIDVLPDANLSGGPVTITVTVDDGTTTTNETFDVTVTAVNDAPTFGIGDGVVETESTGSNAVYRSVLVQPDGKIVVGGYTEAGGTYEFAVTRYNADGSLDASFGSGGQVTTSFGGTTELGYQLALQSDGKILLAGGSFDGAAWDFALVRYNADGTQDSGFGTGGEVLTDFPAGGTDVAYDIIVQDNGRILVAGQSSNGADVDFALARYNADGTLDTSFSGDGLLTTAIGSADDRGFAVGVQSDGKVVIGGWTDNGSDYDYALTRYDSSGNLDTGFGTGGIVTTDFGGGSQDAIFDLAIQDDGKIVVAGQAGVGNKDFSVARYNTDGSLDSGFGSGGTTTIPIGTGSDHGQSLVIQNDGKIVVGGRTYGTMAGFGLTRLNTDGTLDNSFGTAGVAIIETDGFFPEAWSVALTADGEIVVAGSTFGSDYDIAIARVATDGSADTEFDSGLLNANPTYVEDGSPVVLDTDVTVYDAELSTSDNFNGSTLTLVRNGGASADDAFSATGTLAALTEGGNLIVDSTTIGTVATNSGGTLALTFNADATNALVNEAMQQVAYSNSSDSPPDSVQINWTFDDGNSGAQGSGSALQALGSTTVNITAVNDAPVLDTSGLYTFTTITEDDADNAGQTVASIIASAGGDRVTDVDGDPEGMAVIFAGGNDGVWEYSINGGTDWNALGSVAVNNALLLRDTDLLRFNPDGTRGTTAVISFNAWDQSSGTAGSKIDATVDGGTTPFSADWDNAILTVSDVNDAPAGVVASNFTAINEDDFTSAGKLVSDFTTTTTDVDLGSVEGVAVIDVDNSNGTWEYTLNGSDWSAIGNVSDGMARLLPSDATTRVRFVPDPDYNGVASPFTVVAWDQTSGVAGGLADASTRGGITAFSLASASVGQTVTAVNDAPSVTFPGNYIVDEDDPFRLLTGVSVADVDAGSASDISVTVGVNDGILRLGTTTGLTFTAGANDTATMTVEGTLADLNTALGTLQYKPDQDFNGSDSVTLSIDDNGNTGGGSLTDMDSATITVNPINDAPTISAIGNQTIAEDGTTGALAFSVSDVETAAGSLTVTASSSNTTIIPNGNLTLVDLGSGNWTIEAAPALNQNGGPVTITVTVDDGTTTTDETFDVTVTADNDAPTISAIANQTIAEDATTGALAFSVSDVETAAGSLTVTASSSNTTIIPNGNLTLVDLGSGNWTIEAAPALNQNGGPVTITVTVDDGTTTTDETFDVTVTADNDAPTISAIANQTIAEDATTGALAFSVSDVETAAGSLTVTASSSNTTIIPNGNLTLVDLGSGNWTIEAASALNQNGGPVTITVTVDDGTTTTDETFDVTVTADNDAPTISAIGNQTIVEDGTTGALAFSVSDVETAAGSLTVTASSSNTTIIPSGNLTLVDLGSGNWTIEATPALNQNGGPVTITVTVDDGTTTTDETFDVTVTADNDAPTISAIANQTIAEDATTGALAFSVSDVETAAGSLTVTASSSNTTIIPNGNLTLVDLGSGNWTIEASPALNQNGGPVTITVTVDDGTTTTDETFDVTVTADNDAPTISAIGNQTIVEDGTTGALAFSVSDVETAAGSLTVTASSSNTAIIPNGNLTLVDLGSGNWTIEATPALNQNGGPVTITVTVDDGTTTTDETFNVTVTADNDAPTISAIGNQTIAEDGTTGALAFSVSDVETAAGSLSVTASSSNTTIIPNGNLTLVDLGSGNWTIEASPAANQNGGPLTITVTVDDGTTTTDETFDVTVTANNDAPTISTIGNQTIVEDGTTGALAFSVSDVETAAGSLTVTASSSNTTIIPNGNLTLFDLGSGNWTIEAASALNQNGGPVTITVTVDDGTTTTDETFDVTVTADNDAPTISAIANQTIAEDGTTGALAFSVSDVETAAGSLTVTASSSNTTIIPNGNLTLVDLGSGNWTIEASPALNQNGGPVTITVTVDDGTTTTDETFDVTVTADNDDPTNSGSLPSDITVTEDVLSNVDLSAANFADVDAGSSTLTVKLSTSTGGQLSASSFAGVSVNGTATARTFTGSLTNLNNYFNDASRIQYVHGTPHTNGNNADTITVVINDDGNTGSGGGMDVTLGTVNVDITAENDAPTATIVASSFGFTEDDPARSIGGVSVADLDADSNSISSTISVNDGVLTLGSTNGLTFLGGSNGSGSMTVAGTVDDINSALATLTYQPVADFDGTDTLTLFVNDLGSTGGGNLMDQDTASIVVAPVNDAAVLSGIEGANLQYDENDGPVMITTSLTVSDVDDANIEFATIQLTTGYIPSEDFLDFTDTASISGSWDQPSGRLTLTGTDSVAAYQAALRSVTYENTSDDPTLGLLDVVFRVNDGDINSNAETRTISLTPVNDGPQLSGIEVTAVTYIENDPATTITSTLSLSDHDDTHLESASIRIMTSYVSGQDLLDFVDTASITGNWDSGTGTLTLTGTATLAEYQSALRSVTYENLSDNPDTSTRQISFAVHDGNEASNVLTRDVMVTAVNDAPAISTIGDQTIAEDGTTGALAFLVSDVETAAGSLTVTASSSNTTIIPNGNLTLVDLGSGNWTIEAAPALNQNGGPVTITVTVDDGTTTTDETFNVTVTAVNDAPTISAIGNQTIAEDGTTGALAFSVSDVETAAGSLTVTASSSNTTIIPNGNLTLVDLGSGNWTIEAAPALNQNGGPVTITVTVDDGTTTTDETFDVTVTADNDAPTISTIGDQTVAEDGTTGALAFLVSDVETAAGSLTVTASSSNTTLIPNGNLTLVDLGSGNWTIEAAPALNQNGGPVTITVTVDDGTTTTDETFNVTVTAVNDAPTISAIGNQTIAEDGTTGALAFSVSDVETAAGSLTVTASSSNTTIIPNGNLTLVDLGSGNWTIEAAPALNQNGGPVTITVTVDDGTTTTDETFDVTVTAVNDAPTISTIGDQTIAEDGTTGALAFSVSDVETAAGSLTVTASSSNTTIIPNGNLTLVDLGSGNWTIEAAPALNQNGGPVTITVTVDDGTTTTDETFDVTVTAVNDAPTISAIGDQTIAEDGTTGALAFSVSDVETAAGTLTVTATSSNTTIIPNGNLTLVDLGSGNWTIEAAPALNQNGGPVTITVTVDDGTTTTDETFDVTVTAVNDAPQATVDSYSTDEDVILNIDVAAGVLSNDSDVENDTLTASLVADAVNGTVLLNTDGSFTYTPDANFNGTDIFTYSVSDGEFSLNESVTITVSAVNDAPVNVLPGIQTTNEDEPLVFSPANGNGIVISDIDAGTGLLGVRLTGSNGSLTLSNTMGLTFALGDGIDDAQMVFAGTSDAIAAALDGLVFQPDLNFNGSATIDVLVRDMGNTGAGGELTDSDTISISVLPQNDTPVGTSDSYSVDEDETLTVTSGIGVLANDSDVDGDALSVSLVSGPSNGTLSLTTDGAFTYTPDSNFAGLDSFTYLASDGTAATAPVTVTLTIAPVNDAPESQVDEFEVTQTETLTVDADGVLANDSDVEGEDLTAVLVSGPANGLLMLNPDGSFVYVPNVTFSGQDSFTYQATDGTDAGAPVTVTLTVNAVAPIDSTNDPSPDKEPPTDTDEPDSTENDEPTVDDPVLESTDAPADVATFPAGALPPTEATSEPVLSSAEDDRELRVAFRTADVFAHVTSRNTLTTSGVGFRPDSGTIEFSDSPELDLEFADAAVLTKTIQAGYLWESLDANASAREDADLTVALAEKLVVGTVGAVGTSLTVGYVAWLLRGGSLIIGMVSSLPSWTMIDPLPILESGAEAGLSEDGDSLESLLEASHQE